MEDATYWDTFYARKPAAADWYMEPHVAGEVIAAAAVAACKQWRDEAQAVRILQVGCGASSLADDLVARHPSAVVTSIDFSGIVIERMAAKATPRTKYLHMDARNMAEFANDDFHLVVDKGTLDSQLTGGAEDEDGAMAMLQEISRVITPGGSAMFLSLFPPDKRLSVLSDAVLGWSVAHCAIASAPLELPTQAHTHLYVCTKPAAKTESAAVGLDSKHPAD